MVHDALETMKSVLGLYLFSLTPMTYIGASAEGALITTRLAPPVMWAVAWEEEEGIRSQHCEVVWRTAGKEYV